MSRRVRERDDQKNWVHTAGESRFFVTKKGEKEIRQLSVSFTLVLPH